MPSDSASNCSIQGPRERIFSEKTRVALSRPARASRLRKRGFSKSETAKIIETVLHEEGCPPESLFDFAQGITTALWGARHPAQLQPVDQVAGWSLDAAAMAEINQILRELINDPVGPEFMAPPAREA